MQIQKDEIRERLLLVSLEEFYQHGYHETSIKTIARRSGISVGNVYRYFANKEAILDTLVQPVINKLVQPVEREASRTDEDPQQSHPTLEGYIQMLLTENQIFSKDLVTLRKELLILVDAAWGTKYETMMDEWTEKFSRHMANHLSIYYKKRIGIPDTRLAKPMAKAFLAAIFEIFRRFDDPDEMEYLINEMVRLWFLGAQEMFQAYYG
jgi:AcrR family transcriptional regulator